MEPAHDPPHLARNVASSHVCGDLLRLSELVYDDDGPALASPNAARQHVPLGGTIPHDGPLLYAWCAIGPHAAPGPSCFCGLYYATRPCHALGITAALVAPLDRAWSRIEPIPPVYRDPFSTDSRRAAGLRLLDIHVHPGLDDQAARAIGDRYGVPVHRFTPRPRPRRLPPVNMLALPDNQGAAS